MNQVAKFAHAASYDEMGMVLFHDEKAQLTIRRGNIFEARTVKGHTNLLIAMGVSDGFMFYMHADKAKKVKLEQFINAVMCGDLEPRSAKEIDTERLSMASIGLDAIANRRTGEEQIQYFGDRAEERFVEDLHKK